MQAIDATGPVDCDPDVLFALKDAEGQALLTPTLGAMLGAHGQQHWGTGSWTDGCAIMHHPPDDDIAGKTGSSLHCDFSNPPATREVARQRFGDFPGDSSEK